MKTIKPINSWQNGQLVTAKVFDLLKVKIRNYNLIGEQTKQIGVIAQELE
jgi:hypothetical protein